MSNPYKLKYCEQILFYHNTYGWGKHYEIFLDVLSLTFKDRVAHAKCCQGDILFPEDSGD